MVAIYCVLSVLLYLGSLSSVLVFSYIFDRLLLFPIVLHISYIFIYFMIIIVHEVIVRIGHGLSFCCFNAETYRSTSFVKKCVSLSER